MSADLSTLLAAAVRAPSGDNTQPWRFTAEADAVTFYVDETRDPSPMNAGQRMARIAVGAALENLLRAATKGGWSARLEEAEPPALFRVRLEGWQAQQAEADAVLFARVTNRRPYDGRPLAPDVLDRLHSHTPPLGGVSTHWIVRRDRIGTLADLIGRADALMLCEGSLRRAFLANVRFDAAPAAEVEFGLSLASLELSAADRLSLRAMRRLPDWLLRLAAGRALAGRARRLVESSSGLCLVVAPDGAPAADVAVGRAMQRAWLALTELGLAAQPMTSLPVLENVFDHAAPPATLAALGPGRLLALRDELRRAAPEVGAGRPAFLMRFGHAPAPSGRTGRLPWQASLAPTDHTPAAAP